MMRIWLAVAVLAAGLGLGCSQGSESTPAPPPGLDTFRAALQERDELERKYLLTSFLRTMGPADVQPVLSEVEKHRTGFTQDEVRLWMLAWTRFDGPGAFAAARDWPTKWKSILMTEAMYAWGFHDGRAALAANAEIEDEELRETLRQAVVSGWVGSHEPLAVSEYAATLKVGRQRARIALRLAGHAKRDGPEAVIAWADSVPEDAPNGYKVTVFSAAGGAIANLDSERAARWYEAHMQHSYSSAGLRNIASKWAQYHDPEALIAWMAGLPIQEDREVERADASRAAFRIWAADAPEEVEAWIEAASAGSMRDGALEEYARAIADASPGEALRWALQIEEADLRRKRALRYTRQWFVKDPVAARTWLAEANMSPERRQQILNNLPPQAKHRDAAKKAEPDG